MAPYYDLCLECNCIITNKVNNYSIQNYGVPLCIKHQEWIDKISNISSLFAIRLYFDLKQRGVPAELEKYDKFKHIDIVVECAKLHIEVDGSQHNLDAKQALSDIKRTYYSLKDGYYTIRIPNCLTKEMNYLLETANYITEIINYRTNNYTNREVVNFKLPKKNNNRW